MPLINCKVELKLKWEKYYVLSAVGNDNTNANTIYYLMLMLQILFSLSKTQNCMFLL